MDIPPEFRRGIPPESRYINVGVWIPPTWRREVAALQRKPIPGTFISVIDVQLLDDLLGQFKVAKLIFNNHTFNDELRIEAFVPLSDSLTLDDLAAADVFTNLATTEPLNDTITHASQDLYVTAATPSPLQFGGGSGGYVFDFGADGVTLTNVAAAGSTAPGGSASAFYPYPITPYPSALPTASPSGYPYDGGYTYNPAIYDYGTYGSVAPFFAIGDLMSPSWGLIYPSASGSSTTIYWRPVDCPPEWLASFVDWAVFEIPITAYWARAGNNGFVAWGPSAAYVYTPSNTLTIPGEIITAGWSEEGGLYIVTPDEIRYYTPDLSTYQTIPNTFQTTYIRDGLLYAASNGTITVYTGTMQIMTINFDGTISSLWSVGEYTIIYDAVAGKVYIYNGTTLETIYTASTYPVVTQTGIMIGNVVYPLEPTLLRFCDGIVWIEEVWYASALFDYQPLSGRAVYTLESTEKQLQLEETITLFDTLAATIPQESGPEVVVVTFDETWTLFDALRSAPETTPEIEIITLQFQETNHLADAVNPIFEATASVETISVVLTETTLLTDSMTAYVPPSPNETDIINLALNETITLADVTSIV